MTRFVLLSAQRSGSTWVIDMLNSHPRVVAYSELFLRGGEDRPKWAGEKDLLHWHAFLAEHGPPRTRVARTYWLWRYLNRVYAPRPGVDAAGFKLPYIHQSVSRPLVPALVLRRVRIIHLIRRNVLDIMLSKEAAAARGALHAHSADAVATVRVRLPTENLLERITSHDRQVEQVRARFARLRLPCREVFYEELVRDEAEFGSLFDFLGAEAPADGLSSALQKLNPTSHAGLIENYDEVRAALEGTKYGWQLRS
jgi:LPS sulfotransferase NodH